MTIVGLNQRELYFVLTNSIQRKELCKLLVSCCGDLVQSNFKCICLNVGMHEETGLNIYLNIENKKLTQLVNDLL